MDRSLVLLGGAVCVAALTASCGDENESNGATSASATSTGAGGATSSSASTGGSGGQGGSGGEGPTPCLPAAAFEAYFALADDGLCAVAIYDAPVTLGYDADANYYLRVPTWGGHGGPLTLDPGAGGAVDVVRWAAPSGPSGTLTASPTTIAAGLADGVYLGAQALDLPFFGWTAISWTGAFPDTLGEVVTLTASAKAAAFAVHGFYAGASLTAPGGQGRLVYSGLSPVGDAALGASGLYAADSCGDAANGSFLPDGSGTCGAPALVAAWGDASGPVAADGAGNVFAVLTSFDGTQEARGFASSTITRGAGPTEGVPVFTLPGFGSGLAALAPTPDAPGLLFFQPNDAAEPYAALDVVATRFTSDGTTLAADGEPKPALTLATPNTALSMFVDPSGKLWVGVPTGAHEAVFVVLDRAPGGG